MVSRKSRTVSSCKKCPFIGDYTKGEYSKIPHYCCELRWKLFEEEYRVRPDSIDKNCLLREDNLPLSKLLKISIKEESYA